MEDQVSAQDPPGLFSKRSSSNILSDPRILEHLRIVAEEAQSSDKDSEQDAQSEFESNRRELAEKVAAYNKRNQGAFRLILRDELNFEGALRFYFEDGKEELTKAVRLTNTTSVSDLLPTLIEKFKPDLANSPLERKAKLYEVHEEDEIGLDLSDFPLANALSSKQPPRFVLRIDLAKQPEEQASGKVHDKQPSIEVKTIPNGTVMSQTGSQTAKKPASPNLSLVSGQSVGSDTSSVDSFTSSTSFGKDRRFVPASSAMPTNKGHTSKQTTPSAAERAKNFLNFSSAKSPRMFFDGISKPTDQSAHHTHRFLRGRRQRKKSGGSAFPGKPRKTGAKDKVELSTQELAPGILKVFGDHVSPGSNYKSVRATDMTTAEEIVKQALERYSLMDHNSSDYVLCDVIGYFAKKSGSAKKATDASEESDKWITEYSRVIGDKEKPLVLQQLWKPDAGFSRRFELHKRSETEQSSFHKPRGSMAIMRAASTKGAMKVKDLRRGTGESDASSLPASIDEHFQYCSEEGESSGRTSVVIGSLQAPVDTQYLLLLRGFSNLEDILFHRIDEQVTVIGCHDNQLEEVRADIILDDPNLLHQHCTLTKTVEASGPDIDSFEVGFVVNLEPHGEADVRINGVPIKENLRLQPGDLISLGEHYVFLFKDPLQVADRSLNLKWVNSLVYFHEHGVGTAGNSTSQAPPSVNGLSQADDRLRLSYRPEDEDHVLEKITSAVDPHSEHYKLTPAYLFLMCIEHSAKYHSEVQTRKLLLKIANKIQTTASELTTEISNSIDKNNTPDKALDNILPQFKPLIFWQANCLEMFNFLQKHMAHYVSQNPRLTDEALMNADEELLMFLEEVIIYTFQQTVYHLTKVLYIALPAILDTNPFQQLDDDDGSDKKPQEVEMVVNIFQTMYDIMKEQLAHPDIVHQLFAYLFFFANASLFNILMERGTGGSFYRWAKGAQIRGNLDALEAWAVQVELQDEASEYLQKLSTAADLLATPKVQLLQADWTSIRRDFPALNEAQVQQILSEYQLGPGKSRPRGWFPPPEEVEPALRTSDILMSFADHPPLNLPRSGFVVDLERGPENASVFEHLQALGQDITRPAATSVPPLASSDRNETFTKAPLSKTVSSPFPAQKRNHAARSSSAGTKLQGLAEDTLRGPTPARPLRNSTCGGSPLPLHNVHKLDSRSSSSPLLAMTDENENETDHLKKNGVSDKDASSWVRVDVGLGDQGTQGLSVLPVATMSANPEPTLEQDDDAMRQELSSKLEGMRDANDGQDDVFIVELEKNEAGIGLGLIDGLFTPLKSPGIYVRTLVPGGPAVKDGRLRIGDRILAVNGTSLVGADYKSAMLHIRKAGQRLSFLVAKSDIHVAMQITASSC